MHRSFTKQETLVANEQVNVCSTIHITREIQVKIEIASLTTIRLMEIFKVKK